MNPVVLRGFIPALAAGRQVGPTDYRGLQNTFARPLRINEIRIRTEAATSVVAVPYMVDNISAYSTGSIQIRLGNVPITAGFVPVPAVTWPQVDYGAEPPRTLTIGWPLITYGGRYIRFSKPVYLMPGQFFSFQYVYTSAGVFGAGAPPDIEVLAMCHEVDDVRGGYTPWLAAWLPPGHVDGSGNFIDSSTSADLVNPFDDDLEVERLIGRVLFAPVTPVAGDNGMSEEYISAGPAGQSRATTDQIRVRIEDHHATQIVRDSAPFKHVFDIIRRSWAINSVLPAKGFYRVTIESNLSVTGGAGLVLQPYIGMLGYRKVR